MTKGLILALCFIFLIWFIPILFIWIGSKGAYISVKGGKVPSKHVKFIIVLWTIGLAIAMALLILKAIKIAV